MKIDISEWKTFKFGDLVSRIYKSKSYSKDELTICDSNGANAIPYITRTDMNNGCECYVIDEALERKEKGNCIIVGDTTSTCYYQPNDFVTGEHIVIIRADWIDYYTALFIKTLIDKNRYRYSYGRAFLIDKIKETEISLPIINNSDGTPYIDLKKRFSEEGYVPNWKQVTMFMKSMRSKHLRTNIVKSSSVIDVTKWKEYQVKDLFDVRKGCYNKKPGHDNEGNEILFLGATIENNGVTEFYSLDDIRGYNRQGGADDTLNGKLYEPHSITIAVNGANVYSAFYQKRQYSCSHDIMSLYLKDHALNQYEALFLCTIFEHDKYRWSYGRKPHSEKKISDSFIMLPQKSDGTPDWEYMERFIKELPFSDKL